MERFRLFFLYLSLVVVSVAESVQSSPIQRTLRGTTSFAYKDVFVVLASVEDVKIEEVQVGRAANDSLKLVPRTVTYKLNVLQEYQSRIGKNAQISVEGRQGLQGSNAVDIPTHKVGDFILLLVKRAVMDGAYSYAGTCPLPIGIPTPTRIEAKDVESLSIALLRLGETMEKRAGIMTEDEAAVLFQEKDYHLWALGAAGLAANADAKTIRRFRQCFEDPKMSRRQILWLAHCLDSVVAEEIRPSVQDRYGMLLRYLSTQGDATSR
jgi:hypothetical protein